MKPALTAAFLAIALGATACTDKPESPSTSAQPVTQSASPATSGTGREPAPTPSTHAGTPVPDAPATGTARDTSANNPQGDLTRGEENTAMPKAGQANNHSSPAFDPGKAEPKS